LITHLKSTRSLIGASNGEGEPMQARRKAGVIGVIGATGFVGGAVMRALCNAGEDVLSLVPSEPAEEITDNATAKYTPCDATAKQKFRRLEFFDERTFEPAMRGLKRLFLMRPPAIGDVERWVFPLLDEALKAGVERIVFLSVAGAETRAYLPHAKIEARLALLAQRTGLKVGILRPGFFAQNLLSAYREDIKHDDRLYVCAGSGKVAFVDTEDVGAVAARALIDGSLDGKAVNLTGATALTFDDVAALLSDALSRPIIYSRASIPGFFCHRVFHRGSNLMEAFIITALHAGLRRGDAAAVSQALATLLGRPATPLAEVIARHANAWRA
jgi:uncharacterized protein YbjT (DUF2867 family)